MAESGGTLIGGSMKVNLTVFICCSRLAKRLQDRLWGEAGQEGDGEGSHGEGRAEERQPSDEAKEEEEKIEEEKEKEEEKRMREEKEEEEEVHNIKVIKRVINNVFFFLRHEREYINSSPFLNYCNIQIITFSLRWTNYVFSPSLFRPFLSTCFSY